SYGVRPPQGSGARSTTCSGSAASYWRRRSSRPRRWPRRRRWPSRASTACSLTSAACPRTTGGSGSRSATRSPGTGWGRPSPRGRARDVPVGRPRARRGPRRPHRPAVRQVGKGGVAATLRRGRRRTALVARGALAQRRVPELHHLVPLLPLVALAVVLGEEGHDVAVALDLTPVLGL